MSAVSPNDRGKWLDADVLVIGGGPAGAWAALTAAIAGGRVVLAEKGYVGTSGATAPANTTVIDVAPGVLEREAAIVRRLQTSSALADQGWIGAVLDEAHRHLNRLAEWGYVFPKDDAGHPYRGMMRGPDYLRFMRKRLRQAGVVMLEQSPALELLTSHDVVAGAAGINRVTGEPWTVSAGAVVLATGGCAFRSKALGTNGLSGDGYLLAAEAGAVLSGMEFSGQYGLCPAGTSMTKGIVYFWATFSREDGTVIEGSGDRQSLVASELLKGPVYAVLDKASPRLREAFRRGQPNIFLPFDRQKIDPFAQRFPVTLRYEGTVRGVGGLLIDRNGATTVPGLYAAGDAASREALVGAVSGGGGPNATWAIATGVWCGRSAAHFVAKLGRIRGNRPLRAIGAAGLRPTRGVDPDVDPRDLVVAVQNEVLPLDRSFFRTGRRLSQSGDRLDAAWRAARSHLGGSGPAAAPAREAAAMIATARWITASALARNESRGMHRRLDAVGMSSTFQHRFLCGGLDDVWLRPDHDNVTRLAS